MGQAEQQILQMLSEGTISAEEAGELLEALKHKELEVASEASYDSGEVLEGEVLTPLSSQTPPPELNRYRRFWLIPFMIAIGSFLLAGVGLYNLYQAENPAFLGFFCLWPLFLLALLSSVVLILAQRSPWLYINVEENYRSRFQFAFPIPLRAAKWVVRIARPFIPADQFGNIETAASMVNAMQNSPDGEPIVINIDDEHGAKVQIYIG